MQPAMFPSAPQALASAVGKPLLKRVSARRRFLGFLACGSLLAGLSGCTPIADPLRVSSQNWPGYAFMFIAQRTGEISPELIRLLEVPSASESLHALAQDFVDGAALTLDEVLRARAAGVPLIVVAVLDVSAGADMLLARAGIDTLAQLKGKRIGVEHSGTGALILSQVLHLAALEPGDVVVERMTLNEQERNWREGRVDAIVTYEPVASRLLAQGARRLFDTKMIPDTVVDVLAFHAKALQRNPDAVRALIAAHFQALDQWHRHPSENDQHLASQLGVPEFAVAYQFNEMHLTDVAENRLLLSGNPPRLAGVAADLAKILLAERLIDVAPDLSQLFRSDMLPAS